MCGEFFRAEYYASWIIIDSHMTIKQKIWGILIITILIFSIGMAVAYQSSSLTYGLLQRTGAIHYPYLRNIQAFSGYLKGIQENFQNAIVANDRNSITLAQQKALDFRKIAIEIAALDDKKAIAETILTQFDNYFSSAESAAAIKLRIKKGDARPDRVKMVASLHNLETILHQENISAYELFLTSLEESRNNVKELLWVNLAIIIFVVTGLFYSSYRLIASIMGRLESLQTAARQIAQGDFKAYIPEQGNDELTLLTHSFNTMRRELQIATEMRAEFEKQLVTLNLELEDRVVSRTAELGVALEEANKANAAVAYLADHDALTGLMNRRRFQEELDRWGKYALRYERFGALMFIDLDKFKDINDSYGHLAGDEYLLAVAGLLKNALRSTDYLGRWGGDEFVALLPETNAASAQEAADKLLRIFSEIPVAVAGHSIHASVSIGIAALTEHTADIGELMAFADAAMYRGQRSRART